MRAWYVSGCFWTPRLSLGHPGSFKSVHKPICMRTHRARFNVSSKGYTSLHICTAQAGIRTWVGTLLLLLLILFNLFIWYLFVLQIANALGATSEGPGGNFRGYSSLIKTTFWNLTWWCHAYIRIKVCRTINIVSMYMIGGEWPVTLTFLIDKAKTRKTSKIN